VLGGPRQNDLRHVEGNAAGFPHEQQDGHDQPRHGQPQRLAFHASVHYLSSRETRRFTMMAMNTMAARPAASTGQSSSMTESKKALMSAPAGCDHATRGPGLRNAARRWWQACAAAAGQPCAP